MSEKVLSSLMHFLAIFLRVDKNIDLDTAKNVVIAFLQKQFEKEVVEKYTKIFIDFYNSIDLLPKEETSLLLTQVLTNSFTKDLFISLPFKQRIFLITNLLSFSKFLSVIVSNIDSSIAITETIDHISQIFKLKSKDYSSLKYFVLGEYHKILDNNKFLIVTGLELNQKSEIKKHIVKKLKGQFFIFRFNFDFFLISYKGNEHFYLDDKLIIQDNPYIISNQSNISSKDIPAIYFNDLLKTFLNSHEYPHIDYRVNNIEYNFTKKQKGLHPFSFECKQNEMVGIIGSSGVGKSTLLKLLCGILPFHNGEISINNYSLQTERNNVKDLIGYIPQDEVLFEELTVFENILFHARLCMKTESEKVLHQKIFELFENLGLYDIKDSKVGTISHKIISGGQRKRLNIAIELIRNPQILFIDEPTSGLSSSDTEKIINLLKQQALKGKLIFVNVHQPSDQVLLHFDKLIVIDKGGYPIYFGHPGNAYIYLKRKSETVGSSKFDKGFSESEKILEIIEDTTINEFGNSTTQRKIKPSEWYSHLRDYQSINEPDDKKLQKVTKDEQQPDNQYKAFEKQNRINQFKVYLIRNFKTRISNKSYILISLFVAPILALVLAFFCKQMSLTDFGKLEYLFNKNENIPSFIFMSIIVALFIGLMTSAEEIIKDKQILKKEAFLNLSSLSYLGSKLSYLLTLSMLQTLTYTVISFWVLKFNSGFFAFWLSLFFISFLANIIGLIISTSFNSTVAVYIIIPFIIIPQILLSGIVIKFENIHPNLTSRKFTPIISDIMPTRWAYELIMVDQFKNNKYQRNLFDIEEQISSLNFKILVIIPEIQDRLNELLSINSIDKVKVPDEIQLLSNELTKLDLNKYAEHFVINDFINRDEIIRETSNTLERLNLILIHKRDSLFDEKDQVFQNLIRNLGGRENLAHYKGRNFNISISKTLLQKESFNPHIISKNEIIQKYEPIYKYPESLIGRAQFFSPIKRIGNIEIDTIYFNFHIMSNFSIMLVLALILLFRNKYKFK